MVWNYALGWKINKKHHTEIKNQPDPLLSPSYRHLAWQGKRYNC